MPYRATALVAASLLFATQADAAKNLNSSRSNIYREAAPKGAAGPAAVKGSRMGGGGGKAAATGALTVRKAGGSAADLTTVKSSKSNSSDRMGGGGGKSK
jgi:hypothetical protein